MKLNLPNKLTLLRCILVHVFLAVLIIPENTYVACLCSAAIFGIASITDALDGNIARKYNLITNFGKFMDPLADKVLVAAAMVCLNFSGIVNPWITIAVLAREFAVSGLRIAAAAEGNVVAASIWGKAKTMWQFIAITIALIILKKNLFVDICMWINLALTLISGIDYILKNRKYLSYK